MRGLDPKTLLIALCRPVPHVLAKQFELALERLPVCTDGPSFGEFFGTQFSFDRRAVGGDLRIPKGSVN